MNETGETRDHAWENWVALAGVAALAVACGKGGSTLSGGGGSSSGTAVTNGAGGSASVTAGTSSNTVGSSSTGPTTTTATGTATSSTTSTNSSSSSGGGLDPSVHPGGNFNLSGWNLQLPIGPTGAPTTIAGSQLAGPNGFTDIYFYTDQMDGAMTFMDPTTGTTTSGSLHPRSELRETTNGWSTAGINTQTVTEAVTQVPDHVAIGQIFQAPPSPSKPLLELQYVKGGAIKLLLENTNQGGNATSYNVGTVTDGAKFTYQLSLTGTTIKVTVDSAVSMFTMPASFVGESFYFKCGDYDQTAVAGTPGTTPGTVVKVYALNVVHM